MAAQAPTALRTALLDALSKVQTLRAQLKGQQVELATWPCELGQSDTAPDQQLADDRPCVKDAALSHPEQAATTHPGHPDQQQLAGPAAPLHLSPVFPQHASCGTCQPDSPVYSITQPSPISRPSQQHSQHVASQHVAWKLPGTPTRIGSTARLNRPQLSDSPVLGKRKTNAKSCAVRSGIHNFSIKAVAAASRESAAVEARTPASPITKGTPTARSTCRRLLSHSTAGSHSRALDDVALSRHTKHSAARQSSSNATTATPVNSAATTPVGVQRITATAPSSRTSQFHLQSSNPGELRAFLASHVVTRHNVLYDCDQEESPEPAAGVTKVAALLDSCSRPADSIASGRSPSRQLLPSMNFELSSLTSPTIHQDIGTCSTPPLQHRLLRASVDAPSVLWSKPTSSAQKLQATFKSARQAGVYASTSKAGTVQQATAQGHQPRSPSISLPHSKTRSWLSDVGNIWAPIPTGKAPSSMKVLPTEQSSIRSSMHKAGDVRSLKLSMNQAAIPFEPVSADSVQQAQHAAARPLADSEALLTSLCAQSSSMARVGTTPVKSGPSCAQSCPSTPQPVHID